MADISAEELIPLVEQRSVIWDKNSDVFKDKALKAAAWREICCVFNPDFDKLEENEMKDFAKSVNTKWIHIRDAFLRSQKTEKSKIRAGAAKKPRPYVYKNLLNFLTKVNEPQTRSDSCNESQSVTSEISSDDDAAPEAQYEPPPAKKIMTVEKMSLEEKMTRFLDSKLTNQDENPLISFMRGILPSLATFDDDETLEFQAGVVALIQKIRRNRESLEEYNADVKIFGS